ncbi:MAG: hypothetical protein RI885_2151 [Actinomycetota bacterium]|jgi:putative FmdB family regulatory protein
MPTYSYRCTECSNAFDIQQAFTDDSLSECPACGGRLRKVFGVVGVSFTGSGFYRNDSRAPQKTEGGSDGSSGSDAGGRTGSDATGSSGSTTPGGAGSGSSGSEGGSRNTSGGGEKSSGGGSSESAKVGAKPATAAPSAASTS